MTALSAPKNTRWKCAELLPFPVDADTRIYEGGILRLARGLVSPAVAGAGRENDLIIGIADQSVNNNPGTAAARTCLVRMPGPVNLFLLAAGADLANADIGTLFDVMDDQTVQAATANAPVAGRLLLIEAARLGWFDLTIRN